MSDKIFLYDDKISDLVTETILKFSEDRDFHDGLIGNRKDSKLKRRKDYFVKEPHMLRYIDNAIFNGIYKEIVENFGEIKYRETWKIGKYYGDEEGFYSSHFDTAGDTNYRKMSMICSLTDPDDYEGGELCFDDLGLSYKLKKRQIVIFDSSLMHHVNPVTSGLRIVLIGFMFNDVGLELKRSSGRVCNPSNYMPLLDNIKISYHENNLYASENQEELTKKLGDIDYSDKHSIHPWKMTDDFYFEDNQADTLLVTFAGMGWKDSIPTFIFHNFLKEYKHVDKLFLRDINCRYYIQGLKNSTRSFEETIEFYRSRIYRENRQYKKIIAMGCSAGGYAAILYGQILGFDKVIAFSPQTVLTNLKEDLIGDTYNAPKTCQWLRTLRKDSELYQNALDLNNFRPFVCPIDIHYSIGGNNGADKKHALYLQSSNCKLIEHPGKDHMIALTLRNKGKLKDIIDNEFMDDINVLLDENMDYMDIEESEMVDE